MPTIIKTESKKQNKIFSSEYAKTIQEKWRKNPLLFFEELFGGKIWSKQEEIVLTIRDYNRVCVASGNTIGKSHISAKIVLWFLLSHYPSKIITTAPTWLQIEEILWKEIAKLYNNAKIDIGGKLLGTELKLNEEWFALGISTDEVNRFQGFHSENLMVLIDEAMGVNPIIWEAIEGLHAKKILVIGNPLEVSGKFWDCFNNVLWKKINISCQECVNWQKENEVILGLVTQQWINERRDEWGEKSSLYQSRVLGEFPIEGTNLLIQPKWVDEARKKEIEDDEYETKIIASDVATKRNGNYTVIIYRIGHSLKYMEIHQSLTAPMTAQAIKHLYEMKQADNIVIDSDGYGEGVSDIITNQKIGVIEFHGGYGSKAIDSMKFRNLRTQFYWIVSKKFEKGLYSLKDLPQQQYELLKMQLCSIRAKAPDALNRFQIETKEDLIARGIASPDLADAFVYSEYGYYMGKMTDLKPYSYR